MTASAGAPRPAGRPTRVLVVDDSVVVRGLLSQWIESDPDLELVGSAADGAQAIRKLADLGADVCILDLEMPVMGGMEALPRLLRIAPTLKILIASRLTQRGAEITLRALDLGAADYVGKPESSRLGSADDFRRELLAKARALGGAASDIAGKDAAQATGEPPAPGPLRPLPAFPRQPEILAIAASTGGPQALRRFLERLGGDWPTPIVLVQHMPAQFTGLLAVHLGKTLALPVVAGKHGMPLEAGRVHLAPGDLHMRVARTGASACLRLDEGAPENFCRPAADVLFRSVAEAYGDRALGVVLTGMGRDGLAGSSALVRAGGVVMAQDQASSVIWGMPGAVTRGGLASVVGSVDTLAAAARSLAAGGRP